MELDLLLHSNTIAGLILLGLAMGGVLIRNHYKLLYVCRQVDDLEKKVNEHHEKSPDIGAQLVRLETQITDIKSDITEIKADIRRIKD